MKREQIFLSKNFTVIESDIPFTLKFNIKDNTANSAEDIINFKSGWYIFDNNKLLPQYVDGVYNLPKYNCWIEFDETLGTVPPHWYTCYINPKSVESLSSEVTELDPAQLAGLRQDIQINGAKVDSFSAATHADLSAVKTSVDTLQSSNHSDLSAVKTSVDTLQSSNHSDLSAVKSSVDTLQSSNHSDLSAVKSSVDALVSQGFLFSERVVWIDTIKDVGSYRYSTFYSKSPLSFYGVSNDSPFFIIENFPSLFINKYVFIVDVSETATPDGMKFKFSVKCIVNGVTTQNDYLMDSPFQNVVVGFGVAGEVYSG